MLKQDERSGGDPREVIAKETVIDSERYGKLRLSEDQIIRFDKGIIGLQDLNRYGLIPMEDTPFYILHAIDGQISFIVIPAGMAVEGYGFTIDDETIGLLDIRDSEDVLPFLIVNIIDDVLHVNLKAPILIAASQRRGCQFVIHDMDYPIRHPLVASKEEV